MILGVDGSHVHGSIIDGVFAGRIYFPNETFYVEKSEVYLSEPLSFHSVIYSEKNVVDNPDKLKRFPIKIEQQFQFILIIIRGYFFYQR